MFRNILTVIFVQIFLASVLQAQIRNEDSEFLDQFYKDCSTSSKKCWGILYNTFTEGDCVTSKNCNFAFSLREDETGFDFKFIKQADEKYYLENSKSEDEYRQMVIGYVPTKNSKGPFLNSLALACDKSPSVDDFKIFAYSRAKKMNLVDFNPYLVVNSTMRWEKSWLKERCINSTKPNYHKPINYNVKSYVKNHALYKAEHYWDDENEVFDIEPIIFQTKDQTFYTKEDELTYKKDIYTEFYDKCDYPAQKICFGLFEKDCIKNKNCSYALSIRESVKTFRIEILYDNSDGSYYTGATLATYKNLGETSIIECRTPVMNDFKMILYTNLNAKAKYPSQTISKSWINKSKYIRDCLDKNYTEVVNPIKLEKFYNEHSILTTLSDDLIANLKNKTVSLPGLKTKDGFFYTNYAEFDSEPNVAFQTSGGSSSIYSKFAMNYFIVLLSALFLY